MNLVCRGDSGLFLGAGHLQLAAQLCRNRRYIAFRAVIFAWPSEEYVTSRRVTWRLQQDLWVLVALRLNVREELEKWVMLFTRNDRGERTDVDKLAAAVRQEVLDEAGISNLMPSAWFLLRMTWLFVCFTTTRRHHASFPVFFSKPGMSS